tara:strand:+ start:2472 stop:3830 length:1359 start_codon:yes stop_codon:yes gene_type:complete
MADKLITGNSWSTADQVTAALLNQSINSATFGSGAVDGSTTEVSSGAIIVKDGGVTPAKLSTGAPSWGSDGQTQINGDYGGTGSHYLQSLGVVSPDGGQGVLLGGDGFAEFGNGGFQVFALSALHPSRPKGCQIASDGSEIASYTQATDTWDWTDSNHETEGFLVGGVETGMVGAGDFSNHQTSGTAITKQTSIFTTSTATNYAARLPIASSVALGTTLTVLMTGDLGFPIVVYPDDADTIDSDSVPLGGNMNVGSDQLAIFIKTAATVWTARSVNEGSIYAYGRTVWEASHGYAVGDILVKEVGGSTFVKANANNIDTCRQPQVVIEVPDSGVFKVGQIGWAFNTGDEGTLTGLSTHTVYYLSDSTPGTFTTVKPTAPGSYVVPVFVSNTSNSLVILAAGAEPTPVSLNTATLTPATASATGTAGDIAWDASYIYVCTATDTWKRSAISTW